MPTVCETILATLHARPSALAATVLRGEVLPERVPADGLLTLGDGEPEVTLSPVAYQYQQCTEIEAIVLGPDRNLAFDALIANIGGRLPQTALWAGSATGSRRKRRVRSICRSRAR